MAVDASSCDAFALDGLAGRYERVGLRPPGVLHRCADLELSVVDRNGNEHDVPVCGPAALTVFVVDTDDAAIVAAVPFSPASVDDAKRFVRLARDDVPGTSILFDGVPPLEAVGIVEDGALGPEAAEALGHLVRSAAPRAIADMHLVVIPADESATDDELAGLALNGFPGPLPEMSGVEQPVHANRGGDRAVVVAPTGMAVRGHLAHHRVVMLFSQLQVVCALSRLRAIAQDALADLDIVARILRDGEPHRARKDLADIASRQADRQSQLVFGVEAHLDNEFALASPMLGEVHRTLVELVGIERGLALVDPLLQRLQLSLEAARLEVQDYFADVAGVIGAIALIMTLLFGIYGVSTETIEPSNLLDSGYWWIYVVVMFALYATLVLLTRRWLPVSRRRSGMRS